MHPASRLHRVLIALAALGATAPAHAGSSVVDPFKEPDESELFKAEQRVVTVASRYAQTVEQAPSIVTVVTDREIRSRGYRTLTDVLREIPGIFVTESKESRDLAWFRGVISDDNNKFLLLVDGVPWYDGVYTHAWIDEYLPLVNVKQVEVIKGPGSAIYGTNAFAGVINVVTYRSKDLRGGFMRLDAGSDGRVGMSAVAADRLAGRGRDVEVRTWARYLDMDGLGPQTNPRERVIVSGADPRRVINGGIGINAGALDVRVDLVDYRHTYFTNEQDDALDVVLQSEDEFNLSYHNQFLYARYDAPLARSGTVTPYLYAQRYDNPGTYAWFNDPVSTVGDDGSVSTKLSGSLVNAVKVSERVGGGIEFHLLPLPAHNTVGGVGVDAIHISGLEDRVYEDFSHTPVDPSSFRASEDKRLIADLFAYVQHTWTVNWLVELTGGARVDYHNFFGAFPSPRAGILLLPSSAVTVKALYGRAFRAPTARELLVEVGKDDSGSNLFTAGNPDLLPEAIDTVEGELTARPALGLELRGAGFYSKVSQEIIKSTTPDPALGDYYYANQGGSEIIGAEAEASWVHRAWDIDAGYTLTQALDLDTRELRYGFPPHMFHGRITWAAADGLRLSLLGDAYGSRPRAAWTPNSHLSDGEPFGLLHAAVATDLLAHGRLKADLSVRNLLDTDYEELTYFEDADAVTTDSMGKTVPKYPHDIEGEGRTIVVGMEYQF